VLHSFGFIHHFPLFNNFLCPVNAPHLPSPSYTSVKILLVLVFFFPGLILFYTLSDPDLAASMSGLKKFWSDSGLEKEEKFLKVSAAF
jgi:hypothetical protein